MNRDPQRHSDTPLLAWGDTLRADKARRHRIDRRISLVAIGSGIVLMSAIAPPPPILVWNTSASAPVGLYVVQHGVDAGTTDMVVARMPDEWRPLAARRRYLPANVPLVKRVAAAAGDQVCAIDDRIHVEGQEVAERRATDGAGRTMPRWFGCVRLREGQKLLLMDAPDSFDGRYFGVTSEDDIVGKARLIWAR